jgi:hypothetical protein
LKATSLSKHQESEIQHKVAGEAYQMGQKILNFHKDIQDNSIIKSEIPMKGKLYEAEDLS